MVGSRSWSAESAVDGGEGTEPVDAAVEARAGMTEGGGETNAERVGVVVPPAVVKPVDSAEWK